MGESPWGWADAFQLLIQHGHVLSEIRGYTLAQFRKFSDAAQRAHRRHLVDLGNVMRATTYDGNSFGAFMKKLEG